MESKEYFEKVMQDYNQNRKGRSLRKYCKDEAVDYDWLIQYKKNYPLQEKQQEPSQDAFIFLSKSCDNARERYFRHIAMGRRNWLQTGSHFSAQNLAFMFGLLESCKLNKVNFGEYIDDILTRILCGEEVDASFLPCDYVRHFEDGTDAEVTKTSQAVA